ncbi:MAG: hypothetical protein H0T46_19600 [Deltaproteobacteria bacterium]|nr:hypothetical protein [Deltaproteobacteria bacterium]
MRAARLLVALVLGLAMSAAANADVDWGKGLVTAPGIGLADRQAPNPAVARGPSRRRAEDAARAALARQLAALPIAGGGTLAAKLSDPAIKARVDAAVAGAFTVSAEPETDGSWNVTMAVPVEALRQALTGPRALTASDAGPAVAIVEGVSAPPAIGYTIGGIAAATVFLKEAPTWAKGAPRIKAKSVKADLIDADVGKATAATLFVIVTK